MNLSPCVSAKVLELCVTYVPLTPPPPPTSPTLTHFKLSQGTQVASFSLGMAEAFKQKGISLSVFSTYPPGLNNTSWPSLLFKLFAHVEQVVASTLALWSALLPNGAAHLCPCVHGAVPEQSQTTSSLHRQQATPISHAHLLCWLCQTDLKAVIRSCDMCITSVSL